MKVKVKGLMDEEQGSDLIRAYICVIKSLVACSEEVRESFE